MTPQDRQRALIRAALRQIERLTPREVRAGPRAIPPADRPSPQVCPACGAADPLPESTPKPRP